MAHFLTQLPNLWREGEVRPTHQEKAGSAHYRRTRPDPFATVWEVVQNWLATQPKATAKALFQRLQGAYPDTFPPGQLRALRAGSNSGAEPWLEGSSLGVVRLAYSILENQLIRRPQ